MKSYIQISLAYQIKYRSYFHIFLFFVLREIDALSGQTGSLSFWKGGYSKRKEFASFVWEYISSFLE